MPFILHARVVYIMSLPAQLCTPCMHAMYVVLPSKMHLWCCAFQAAGLILSGPATAQAQMYPQAATCYEELLMHQPASAATHIQYADVLYTIGGSANYQTARTHYSSAIDISSGRNLRALYGLCATSAQLKKETSRVIHLHLCKRPYLQRLGLLDNNKKNATQIVLTWRAAQTQRHSGS